ncbi:MAG TPA: hypothetical protein VKU41_27030 [Polyangiaceae bacterium]|nr:hypothetical protein [Polyangiaceae bacterium]
MDIAVGAGGAGVGSAATSGATTDAEVSGVAIANAFSLVVRGPLSISRCRSRARSEFGTGAVGGGRGAATGGPGGGRGAATITSRAACDA